MKQEIQKIKIEELKLWTENPRDPMDYSISDFEIIKKAVEDEKTKWNLPKLLKDMGPHYDFSELPTVVEQDGKKIIFDGNRRVAILKYLQNKNIYQAFGGGMFPEIEPVALLNLKEIPCNICDKETALTNIERKHIKNGSWGQLEIDYFMHHHRRKEKSLFIKFEEATSIISTNPGMNQEIVKNNILTKNKLLDIGFSFNERDELVSIYDDRTASNILNWLVELKNKKIIQSRDGKYKKYQIKEPLQDIPELKNKIKKFTSQNSKKVNFIKEVHTRSKRKTQSNITPDILFGKTLTLKKGQVNSLYCAIDDIYEKFKNDKNIEYKLPIIGMSLRLILDIAAREILKTDKEQAFRDLLKKAKKEMKIKKEDENFLALTNSWLDGKENIEGILSKYAHGSIPADKGNILKLSKIAGEILEYYLKK